MGLIDKFLGTNNNDVSTVFSNDKVSITAVDAYQKSRFGIIKTDKQMLEEFFIDIKNLIEAKNYNREYCGMVEIDKDIVSFIPKIKEKLSKELGFKVIILDDNSVITNSVSKTTDTLKCGTTFVMLIWNKQAIEEVAALNAIQEKEETELSTIEEQPTQLGPDADKKELKHLND